MQSKSIQISYEPGEGFEWNPMNGHSCTGAKERRRIVVIVVRKCDTKNGFIYVVAIKLRDTLQ